MTTSQLAPRNGASSDISWTDEQKQLIKNVIAPGCSVDELRLFAYHCQRTGLDPFAKQIYAIKRGGKLTIQVSIDGLRAIAERTGELGGSQRYWCGENGEWKDVWLSTKPPAAAKCVVYRKGSPHPFVGVALMRDYNAGQGLWNKMPSVMLGKCAEAQALRSGFPADLSGLYASEEMDQADARPINVQPVANIQPAVDAVVSVEPELVEPVQAAAPVQEPVAEAPAEEANSPVTGHDELSILVNRLTATGRRALIKLYQSVVGFGEVKTIEEWLEIAASNASVHASGLTDKSIASLNEGRHPRTNEQVVSKPGRKPAADAPASSEAQDDQDNPFS